MQITHELLMISHKITTNHTQNIGRHMNTEVSYGSNLGAIRKRFCESYSKFESVKNRVDQHLAILADSNNLLET